MTAGGQVMAASLYRMTAIPAVELAKVVMCPGNQAQRLVGAHDHAAGYLAASTMRSEP